MNAFLLLYARIYFLKRCVSTIFTRPYFPISQNSGEQARRATATVRNPPKSPNAPRKAGCLEFLLDSRTRVLGRSALRLVVSKVRFPFIHKRSLISWSHDSQ